MRQTNPGRTVGMPGPKVIISKSSAGPECWVDYDDSRLFFIDCHAFARFLSAILEQEGSLEYLKFKMYMTEECWVLGWLLIEEHEMGSRGTFAEGRITRLERYVEFVPFGKLNVQGGALSLIFRESLMTFIASYLVLGNRLSPQDDKVVVISPVAKKSLKLADLFHTPDPQGRRLLYKFEKYENSGRLAVLQIIDAMLVEVANEWPSCTVFVCPAWFEDVAKLFARHEKCKFTPPALEMKYQAIQRPPFDAFLDPLFADQLECGKGGFAKPAVSNFIIDRCDGGGAILRPISSRNPGAKSATSVILDEFLRLLPKSQIYTYEIVEKGDGLCEVRVPRLGASFRFAQGVLADVAVNYLESYQLVNKLLFG